MSIEYKSDAFISWGWNKTDYFKNSIFPLSSPKLSNKTYRLSSERLIFVNSSLELFHKRIDSNRQPSRQIHARKEIISFFQNLKNDAFNKSLYRPFFDNGGLDDKSYILQNLPNLQTLDGDLHKELLKCKLVVLNAPNTTFNIAIALNIPIVCFWEKNDWGFDSNAQKYFDLLVESGIIFENPLDAANKVNDIWENVLEWWLSKKIQQARIKWKNLYAKRSSNWKKEWIRFIKQL